MAILGNPHFKNEGLIAYELGYRVETFHASLDGRGDLLQRL